MYEKKIYKVAIYNRVSGNVLSNHFAVDNLTELESLLDKEGFLSSSYVESVKFIEHIYIGENK